MRKRIRICVTAAVVAAIAVPGAASANRDHPPGAHVHYRGEWLQRAHASADCWPGENGGFLCGEANPQTWPKPDRVRDGALVRFRINVTRKPNHVSVRSYRSISRRGRGEDRGKRIDWGLRRVRLDGHVVAWDVAFRLHAHRVHYVHVIARCPYVAAWNARLEVW